MRLLSILLFFVSISSATNIKEFFLKDKENKILCKACENSYKIISQKNADIIHIRKHDFFKMKGENLYIHKDSCEAIGTEEKIIF
jgi:hypothetical protein